MSVTKTNVEHTHGSLRGVFYVLLGATGFSAKSVLVKLAYAYGVDTETLLNLRMGFSMPFFIATAVWFRNDDRLATLQGKDWLTIAALGLLGYYLASYLDFLGLRYITASLERLILFLYPTIVVMMSALLARQPVRQRVILAILLSYGGISLALINDISMQQKDLVSGAALIFGSALSYAIYLVGSTHFIHRLGASLFTAYAMIVSCLAIILQFFATHHISALRLALPVYGLALAMAIFSTVLPSFFISAGIRHIGAGRTALIGTIGPVLTIALAYLFLNEPVTVLQLAGTALVCLGVWIVSKKDADA